MTMGLICNVDYPLLLNAKKILKNLMKSLKLPLILIAMLVAGISFQGCKNEGCTDINAVNYDPDAKDDDGSCIYDSTETITDNGNGTGTTTWTKDKTYLLEGFVFVNSGQTLTIEAGTVIKGKPGSGVNASALIVARGGRIIAEGTSTEPIIFTAEQDDVDDANDIPHGTKGLWGGLIILGKATLNTIPNEQAIEGVPTTELRGIYGGTDDQDDSGILKYISVRYGGSDIGAGNEINGVTFGGVGTGTVVEHIEVFSNADDGFEWFGGTVNTKWLTAAFCGDDAFDYDQGFRGQGQYWFAVNDAADGDRGGEHDGGTDPENGTPYAKPVISNATYIGRGNSEGTRTITLRDNAGGEYHNSIFVNFQRGVDIEILSGTDHSYKQYQDGNIKFRGNHFYNVADQTVSGVFKVSTPDTTVAQTTIDAAEAVIQADFGTTNTVDVDPGVSINYSTNVIDVLPSAAASAGAQQPSAIWFDQVSYKGAFGTSNWLNGWSALSTGGYF